MNRNLYNSPCIFHVLVVIEATLGVTEHVIILGPDCRPSSICWGPSCSCWSAGNNRISCTWHQRWVDTLERIESLKIYIYFWFTAMYNKKFEICLIWYLRICLMDCKDHYIFVHIELWAFMSKLKRDKCLSMI